MPTTALDYRPDIDGLRAVAVLLVVLFHLAPGLVTGGFVGVDVFFVISGFLITRIIAHDVGAEGGFSFFRFYARRARRILPALFCTTVVAALGAFLLFPPLEFARFGGSMLFSMLNLANFFFWSGNPYWDGDAVTKPLLHLWSIGVEEQFYAIWPILLVLLLKRSTRAAVVGLAAAGAASLWLNEWFLSGRAVPVLTGVFPTLRGWMADGAATVFYLMPFRIFEFVIGALMVWLVAIRPRRTAVPELLLVAGLTLIAYAAFSYTQATVFPYVNALVPCVGTALVIYGGTAPTTGRLLRNPVTVRLGLISYSIYLLHWPLIVLFGAWTFTPKPTSLQRGGLLLATLAGAAVMYRYVELPFRRGIASRWAMRKTLGVSAATAAFLAVPGASAWKSGGWAWRLPAAWLERSDLDWRDLEFTSYCRKWDPSMRRPLLPCQNYRGASKNIFLWGDSHALHLIAGFSEAYKDYNVYVIYRSGCLPQSGFAGYVNAQEGAPCGERNRDVLDFLLRQPRSTVVLSGAKRDKPEDIVAPTVYLLQQLRDAGHRAFMLSDFIRPGKSLISCRSVPDWLVPDGALPGRCAPDGATVEREMRYNARLLELMPEIVDVGLVQCPRNTCVFRGDDGTPYFRDVHHLTTEGSIRLIARLREVMPIASDAGASRE